jgi:major vault protein
MSNETRLKVPVPRRMFIWSMNESSGEVITHIGPTEFTPSANDRVVQSTVLGGYEPPLSATARPFLVAREGEYIVLRNPVPDEESSERFPNGTFLAGANKEKELTLGSTRMIPGPCGFPLWPGQFADVRQAHKLNANEYLLVEVVGRLDERAQYARLVVESAGLSSAVIDAGEGSGGDGDGDAPRKVGAEDGKKLRIGRRIIIQGRHTQLFIPPSGIEVVSQVDESADGGGGESEDGVATLRAGAAQECARQLEAIAKGVNKRQFSVIKNELRHRQDLSSPERAIILTALDEAFESKSRSRTQQSRGNVPQAQPSDPYARRAVVLGPKAFCFLFDADGNARIVRGPARVFPGPYDTFLKRGSRNRAYSAYELAEHQALWLRLISPISRADLAACLPPGYPLDRDQYDAGHEFIIRGLPSVFFPFIQAEVINPVTREPHVGNNHDDVILNAIGIDQHSGIYIRDQRTGMVKLVRGQTSYLVDPRYEEHIERTITGDQWNLLIGRNNPHRVTSSALATTPWALSVTIPNNEAVMVLSPRGRRVEVGPKLLLLEHDEDLAVLRLSKGPSKNGHSTLTTCFLRVEGAQFADTFEVESADFVRLRVKLGFTGAFEGEPSHWFNVADPVKLLADVVRARMREASHKVRAVALLKEMPALVRATLFTEGSPLRLPENGLRIDAADLLDIDIVHPDLSRVFGATQQEAVKLELDIEQARRRLITAQERDRLDAQEHLILGDVARRKATLSRVEAEAHLEAEARRLQLQADLDLSLLQRKQELQRLSHDLDITLERQRAALEHDLHLSEAQSQAQARDTLQVVDRRHQEALATIRRDLADAFAHADATRLAAIQPQLVGALHAAADAEVMKAAAENMNLVSLLGGKSPAQIFDALLRGTPLSRTPQEMLARSHRDDDPPSEG